MLLWWDRSTAAASRVASGPQEGCSGLADEVSVLRWFERNRTDAIGGGPGLQQLKELGHLCVVTSALSPP